MKQKLRSPNIFFLYIFIYIFYITYGTGLHSDDWNILNNNKTILEYLFQEGGSKFLLNIVTFLIYYLEFKFFELNYIFLYDAIKAIIIFFTYTSCYIFLNNFYNKKISIILSLTFILMPNHDSTLFWVMGQYTLIAFSFLFLSIHFFYNNKKIYLGILFGTLGVFTGYGSPPIIFGLSIILLLKKKYKHFFLFLLPLLIYLIFYFYITLNSNSNDFRLNLISNETIITQLLNNYIIQLLSFIDANLGPSFLLKFVFGIQNINLLSFVISVPFIYLIFKSTEFTKFNISHKILIFSTLLILLSSLFVFALTGKYPQISFGLGNRVTLYASLFVVILTYTIISFFKLKFLINILFILTILSSAGTSNHWKEWNDQQMQLFYFLSQNKNKFEDLDSEILFVEGMQFSNLYLLDHIDTFATSSVTPFFNLSTNLNFKVYGINNNLKISDDNKFVINKKYNIKYPINKDILIFSTSKREFEYINSAELNLKIKNTVIKRHWLSLNNFTIIKKLISFFSNRYKKHFDDS